MLVFNLTTLHLWGRTLAKYPQAPALAYADDSLGVSPLHLFDGIGVPVDTDAERSHTRSKAQHNTH